MSKKLLSLQRDFAKHLQTNSNQNILQEVSYSKTEALARLNIYRNNVYGGFESVLSSIFPVTKNILGEEKFNSLLKKYCEKFPSKSGDLNKFGDNFPKFLNRQKPSFLKDLSQVELLHHQAYFVAKCDAKLDIKKLQELPKEKFYNLTFSLNNSCTLFTSKFAVFSIWKKNSSIKEYQKTQHLLIRSDDILLLKEVEFAFLSLISKQQELFDIYAKLCKDFNKSVDVGALLQKFISNETIVNYA
jgi:hypothetical protein